MTAASGCGGPATAIRSPALAVATLPKAIRVGGFHQVCWVKRASGFDAVCWALQFSSSIPVESRGENGLEVHISKTIRGVGHQSWWRGSQHEGRAKRLLVSIGTEAREENAGKRFWLTFFQERHPSLHRSKVRT